MKSHQGYGMIVYVISLLKRMSQLVTSFWKVSVLISYMKFVTLLFDKNVGLGALDAAHGLEVLGCIQLSKKVGIGLAHVELLLLALPCVRDHCLM